MKICVFGAGAVGGHMAAMLARTGAEVSVVVRGAALAAIRAQGLTLHTTAGVLHADVRASDDPAELGPQDVVLVGAKSTSLSGSAEAIARLLGPATPAVFLQNGIPWWYYHGHGGDEEGRRLPALDPGNALWDAVGPQRVVGCLVFSAATVREPGVIEVPSGNRALVLGEPDGSLSPRVQQLGALLGQAGFSVECTQHIRQRVWTKLALNLASGPLGVLSSATLGELFADLACREARYRILAEAAMIADAMGCGIQLDFAVQNAMVRNSPHRSSVVQDTMAGRKPEIESMFLAPLQMARDKGVATPTLDLLVSLATLKLRAEGLYP